MCGLAGVISLNPPNCTPQLIKKATDTITHRGPQAEGFYFNSAQTVALGHRRLCIIDLSANAAQPMQFAGRYHMVYNGELYNYLEVKKELEAKGIVFHTQSDSEVLLAAYATYGPACLDYFDGMFAFLIWDEKEQMAFAARDRMGEKPFFFFYDGEQFAFASEMKALWALGISQQVNESMLYNFLSIGYTTNPADPTETFYKNIQQLPAATYLQFHLHENKLSLTRYWQVTTDVDNTVTEDEALQQFQYLFEQSIKRRMRSDVAIGTSLSGGLDSSAIVAFSEKISAKNYTHACFTAGFQGFEKDETATAALVARQFQLQHYITSIEVQELPALMDKVAASQEIPFSSSSVLAQYKVFELAKQQGVTVLLDGQGADELLAGYHKYYKWHWLDLYRKKKLSSSGELNAARALGIVEEFGIKNKLGALLPHFGAALLQSRKEKNAYKNKDLNRDFAFANKQNLNYSMPATFDLNGALYYNTFVNGLDELLRLADRNSMAHAVEVRLPFLQHELVSFLFSLPPHFKIHNGWTKWLLRRLMQKTLPKEIVWNSKKIGYETPQKLWMQNKQVIEAIHHAKQTLVSHGVLNKHILQKAVTPGHAYQSPSSDWRYWSASYLF